ncbi:MAG: 2-amino-4-hydroxy-6-hydroxymethyldihydropteridine diphosphokinase [Methylovulum sp.]|nr:2-amino-4-hydroxy-6-hydroxymethyldihydropteridine diphosphokinase [Methylovulum sp.]
MTVGYISIGSNIDQNKHIPAGLQALKQCFGKLSVSSIYESAAVGFEGDHFYNLIVGFNSDLKAKQVAKKLRQIELDNGRTVDSQKFSARTLDLDLILYGNLVINDGQLHIPRDEIERYAFVLEPLAEIAPTLKHPISHLSYEELWEKFNKTGLQQHCITPDWASAE